MTTGDLVNIHPTELKFPFELKKQSSCSMQLTNKISNYVAFKVKTTNPRKYRSSLTRRFVHSYCDDASTERGTFRYAMQRQVPGSECYCR